MFIKKDLRKIEEILVDETDNREILKFSKRSAEFHGSLRILCRESKLNSLANLKVLNLYDNSLMNIDGIGLLSQTPVEEINLGANKLGSLPLEFGSLSTLKTLWLDDNLFDTFPTCICQLKELSTLRISGNSIKHVPPLISCLSKLEILAIDNNEINEFPEGITKLLRLRHLWIRQNKLTELPDDMDKLADLVTLSISSNQIEALPDCLTRMTSLQFIYANGNRITTVPEDLPTALKGLKEVNLSNNALSVLPQSWIEHWGTPDSTGKLTLLRAALPGEDKKNAASISSVTVNVLSNAL